MTNMLLSIFMLSTFHIRLGMLHPIQHTLERIYDFQFMYIIWFLVVYLTYFMKPVQETIFSSKIHKTFFANIRNDCVFSVIKNKQYSYAIRVRALSS